MDAKNKVTHRFGTRIFGFMPAIALGTAIMVAGGCVSYANVPVPESAPAFKSANHFQSVAVMTQALDRIVFQHPSTGPGGQYAINLPVGTTPESASKIIEALPAGAIVPFNGMSDQIPVYHICRVWIRATDAKVDVIYPSILFDGSTQNQNVTFWMRGGLQNWRVHRQQFWAAGTLVKPALYIPIELTDPSETVPDGTVDINEEAYDQLEDDTVDDTVDNAAENAANNGVNEAEQALQEEPASQTQEPSGSMYRQVPIDD